MSSKISDAKELVFEINTNSFNSSLQAYESDLFNLTNSGAIHDLWRLKLKTSSLTQLKLTIDRISSEILVQINFLESVLELSNGATVKGHADFARQNVASCYFDNKTLADLLALDAGQAIKLRVKIAFSYDAAPRMIVEFYDHMKQNAIRATKSHL